jgi:uncharacterized protein with HEPN domain
MAGMRDKLIHGYTSVNLERIFETVCTDLPKTKAAIIQVLNDLNL